VSCFRYFIYKIRLGHKLFKKKLYYDIQIKKPRLSCFREKETVRIPLCFAQEMYPWYVQTIIAEIFLKRNFFLCKKAHNVSDDLSKSVVSYAFGQSCVEWVLQKNMNKSVSCLDGVCRLSFLLFHECDCHYLLCNCWDNFNEWAAIQWVPVHGACVREATDDIFMQGSQWCDWGDNSLVWISSASVSDFVLCKVCNGVTDEIGNL